MGMMVQFPSPALWHQILSVPPVSRDQGTQSPNGGFNELVQAQLANQNAIAGLQPPPPRPPMIQRHPQKDPRGRDPRDPRQHPSEQGGQEARDQSRGEKKPLIRTAWA